MSDKQNWMTEAGVDMSVTCMITNRIGQHKVLLAINHNHYNFWKKVHVGQCLKQKIWKFPRYFFFFFQGKWLLL